MTKEFENIQKTVVSKRIELDTITRISQQNKEIEERNKKEQERANSEKRAIENRKIFEEAGVVKLFEEIRDSGLVKCNDKPIYGKESIYKKKLFGGKEQVGTKIVKLADYIPAKINWGEECGSISLLFNERKNSKIDSCEPDSYNYDCCYLEILSNKKIGISKSIQDPNDSGYILGGGGGKSGEGKMIYKTINIETEITNIPKFIADKLIEPDNSDKPRHYKKIAVDSSGTWPYFL
ncbi:MAG: hypothetical protein PHH12_03615 [Candidatus Shapirobacteria bacterium]|nr:hypothetical protein [Candidatus Shapirobacteria bacterium]